jgi:hypothetical protein
VLSHERFGKGTNATKFAQAAKTFNDSSTEYAEVLISNSLLSALSLENCG